MNILFTHSYFLKFDPKQDQWNKPYPPLMTIQAASLARSKGHQVDLFDVMFAEGPEALETCFNDQVHNTPDVLVIYDDGFNYLTKMCLTNMREAAWKMSHLAKKYGCKVIICSSDATDHYEKYLENHADVVILGEGEATLLEVLSALQEEQDFSSIKGIAYLDNNQLQRTAPRPTLSDLDALPLPAWDLIRFEPYRDRWVKNWGYYSINLATTRGCPYKCNWCAKPIYGNAYKMRSPQHVIREIQLLKSLTDFQHIWFCDDIFGLKRSWVIEFAKLVTNAGIKIQYKIQSRADLLVQEHYVEALAASGCDEVWIGVESGSQHILDAMDKGITIEQARTATHLLKKHHIKPCFFIQFGYLGETADDIKLTIQLIKELLPHDIGISVSYPLPGTLFFEKVKRDLFQKANWTHSDDLDLMFQNTYKPEFYKVLHKYVHFVFRKHKAWHMISQNKFSLNGQLFRKLAALLYFQWTGWVEKQKLKAIDHEAARRI